MYQVLDIGIDGMNSISFKNPTQWVLDTDLETVLLPDGGELNALNAENMNFIADKGQNVRF